ncbi:MAG: hypothetical protein J6U92_02680 [Clostridia bacterium]|nr:hypothetical protein [Clostridia bacterium]
MQEVANYKTELEKNGVIAFVPKGDSMWPIIKNHKQSVVIRKKEPNEQLKPFDVPFYLRANGAFVLHRIISVTKNGYLVCGDSQFDLELVKDEQIFGVLMGFYKGKKYVKADNHKYIRHVEKWYRRKTRRKIILKIFYFRNRVVNKLKRIFKKNGGQNV